MNAAGGDAAGPAASEAPRPGAVAAVLALPRSVWLIGLVSFFNDTSSELVYPLVPLYLATVLGAGPRAIGLIEGIAEATGALLKLFSGAVSDRRGSAKPWMVAGYSLAGIARPAIAFAASWPGVLALRFLDRVGKGLRSAPRDALLALAAGDGRRGLAYGIHRAMDNAGAVIGPLIAWALIAAGVSLRQVFLASAVGGVVAVAFALAVREPARAPRVAAPRFEWTTRGLPRAFRFYLVSIGLFALGNSSTMFLLLHVRDAGFPESRVPLLWAATALTAALFGPVLSAMSDRVGRIRLVAGGWLLHAALYATLALGSGAGLAWPIFVVYGLHLAAVEGAQKALVADLTPPEALGRAFGWFHLVQGLALLPASIAFGLLHHHLGPPFAFGFGSCCAILASGLLAAARGAAKTGS